MSGFNKKVSLVLVMIAALAAVIPAFAAPPIQNGGPGDGYTESLEMMVVANGVRLERNTFSGKYHVRPGAILSFVPQFIGRNGEVVPPPVSKLGWDLSVVGAPGVVSPFKGPHAKSQKTSYRTHKPGFVYVTGSAFSGDASIEFHRTVAETIIVSNAPAPVATLDVSLFPYPDGSGTAIVQVIINNNIELSDVQIVANSSYGRLDVSLTADQGTVWKRLNLEEMWGMDEVSSSACLTLWSYSPELSSDRICLDDGIMQNGVLIPVPIPASSSRNGAIVSWQVQLFKG